MLRNGELPTDAHLADFLATESSNRPFAPEVKEAIDYLPLDSHPMDEVRTAVSVIGAIETAGISNVLDAVGTPEENLQRSLKLFATLPAIVSYGQRRRRGLEIVESRDDLDYAAN